MYMYHYCGQVATLMVLNLFSFLLGFSALLSYALNSVHAVALKTSHQVAHHAASKCWKKKNMIIALPSTICINIMENIA